MSRSINEVLLYGNVGKDPEIREAAGTKVATFTLATSTGGYKKKDGTDVPEVTQWHNIVVWRQLAEVAEKYIRKGSKIIVKGSISYRNYENQNGQKVYVTEIIGTDISLTGTPQEKAPQQAVAPAYPPIPNMPPEEDKDDLPF